MTQESSAVKIGKKLIGDGQPCYVIAEIGINHNGNLDIAKRLISVAVAAGCDAVKFQKRTIDVVYSPPTAKPCSRRNRISSSGAAMPIWA